MAGDEVCLCCFYLLSLGIALSILLVAVIAGRVIEIRHFASLKRREQALKGRIVVHNLKTPLSAGPRRTELVIGSVVLGADRFKTWLAGWRQLVGGRMGSLDPVLERARREAILRMAEAACAKGFPEVCNVRLITADLKKGQQNAQELMVEVIAYGTAVA